MCACVLCVYRERGREVSRAAWSSRLRALPPASQHRDYQISADWSSKWLTVGGIRSTGLTAASGIGEYVAALYAAVRDGCDFVDVDHGAVGPPYEPAALEPAPRVANGKVPSLGALREDFQRRNDGTVQIYGRLHRVTHPITAHGLGSTGAKLE